MKRFLEMRGADGNPWEGLCALPALWVGLLYDQQSLDAAWDLVKDWTSEDHAYLRAQVPKTALRSQFHDAPLSRVAGEVLRNMKLFRLSQFAMTRSRRPSLSKSAVACPDG